MKKISSLLIPVLLLAVILTGCSKDKGKAPALPTLNTMVIDFSDFDAAKSAGSQLGAKDIPDPDENFMFSSETVGVWDKIISEDLAIPAKALEAAQGGTAISIADKTWEWKVSFTSGSSYTGRIVGKILSDKVEWEIYIKGGSISAEFVWVEGTSATDGKSGRWIMNYNNTFPEPYLQIDWTKATSTVTPITYTYVRTLKNDRTTDPFKTSFLKFESVSASLNGKFTIKVYEPVTVDDFVDVFIEWNTTAGNGKVKAEYKFGNANFYCWDVDKNNITCPI
jgi:hypothetical protein